MVQGTTCQKHEDGVDDVFARQVIETNEGFSFAEVRGDGVDDSFANVITLDRMASELLKSATITSSSALSPS